MPYHCGLAAKPVLSYDFVARVDPGCMSEVRARKIYRGELAVPVSEKAVLITVASTHVLSDNLAGGIDTERSREDRAGNIDRSEGSLCWFNLLVKILLLCKSNRYRAEQTAHQAHHPN